MDLVELVKKKGGGRPKRVLRPIEFGKPEGYLEYCADMSETEGGTSSQHWSAQPFFYRVYEGVHIINGMAPNQPFLTELAAGRLSHIGNMAQGDRGTRRQKGLFGTFHLYVNTFYKLFGTCLLMAPLVAFGGCSSDDDRSHAADAAIGMGEIGGNDTPSPDVPEVAEMETENDSSVALDAERETSLQCGLLTEDCIEGATVLVADEVGSTTLVTAAMSTDGGLVVWSDGEIVRGRRVGPDGVPIGDSILIHKGGLPVSNIEVLVSPQGFVVLFSRGTVDGVGSPDEILDFYARVATDGVLVVPAVVLTTGVQLMRGAALSETGLRMWGIRDAPSQDTGEVFRQASMIRATVDGVFQETHYMLNASKFGYMRMHASGNQLNVPFVDPSPKQAVSYLLQNVNLPGCGVPVAPVLELGASETMIATTFLSPLVAMWAVRGESPDGERWGTLFFHNTAYSTTEAQPLPWVPTDLADLAAHEQGLALMLDFEGSQWVATLVDPYVPCVREKYVPDGLPEGKTPVALRVTPSGGGFFAVWATKHLSGSQVWGRQHCPGD